MTPEERKEYVKYRINTAYKTVDAAKVLADNGFWNSAVNRLYYALFYKLNYRNMKKLNLVFIGLITFVIIYSQDSIVEKTYEKDSNTIVSVKI